MSSKNKEPCNTFYDELINDGLSRTDKCDVCFTAVGLHKRKEQLIYSGVSKNESSSKDGLSSVTTAFMKLSKHLPSFDLKTTECRQFLQSVELTLTINEGIPEDKWPRVFLYIIKDCTAATWIKENIIDTDLDWNAAKSKFISHFQRADHNAQLISKYENIKQTKGESVQNYSD